MTNETYLALAYRKAILTETISMLRRKFCRDASGAPQARLTCEEVFFAESEVTEQAFLDFLHELTLLQHSIDLKMKRYALVEQDGPDPKIEPKTAKGGEKRPRANTTKE